MKLAQILIIQQFLEISQQGWFSNDEKSFFQELGEKVDNVIVEGKKAMRFAEDTKKELEKTSQKTQNFAESKYKKSKLDRWIQKSN